MEVRARIVALFEHVGDRGHVPQPDDRVLARIRCDGVEQQSAVGPVEAEATVADDVAVLDEQRGTAVAASPSRQQWDDEDGHVGVEDGGAHQDPVGVALGCLVIGQAHPLPQLGQRDRRVAVGDRRRPRRPAERARAETHEREEVVAHLVQILLAEGSREASRHVDRARPVCVDGFEIGGKARQPAG